MLGKAGLVSLSWSQHPAGEGMLEFEAKKKSQGKSLHLSMLARAFVLFFFHSLIPSVVCSFIHSFFVLLFVCLKNGFILD